MAGPRELDPLLLPCMALGHSLTLLRLGFLICTWGQYLCLPAVNPSRALSTAMAGRCLVTPHGEPFALRGTSVGIQSQLLGHPCSAMALGPPCLALPLRATTSNPGREPCWRMLLRVSQTGGPSESCRPPAQERGPGGSAAAAWGWSGLCGPSPTCFSQRGAQGPPCLGPSQGSPKGPHWHWPRERMCEH